MSFRETSPRHYKRIDYKNKRGSNQYKTRRKNSIKGFLTLVTFLTMVGFWGYTQVNAAEFVSPLPKADIVKNEDVATTSAELSPTQIADYIRMDQEKDAEEREWRKQQQQFNQAMDAKVNMLGSAVSKIVEILDGLLGGKE